MNTVRTVSFISFILLIVGLRLVHAEQFVMFDWVFENKCKWMHWRNLPNKGVNPDAPRNWVEPVNYRDGTYHLTVEIRTKQGTGDQDIIYAWMNKANDPPQGILIQRLAKPVHFTKTGVYKVTDRILNTKLQHASDGGPWDWTSAYDRIWTESHNGHNNPPFICYLRFTVISEGAQYDEELDNTVLPVRVYPNGGEFEEESITVVCSTYTFESVIRYTLDGTEPTESSPACSKLTYDHMVSTEDRKSCPNVESDMSAGEIELTKGVKVKFRAFREGMNPSPVTTAEFSLAGDVSATTGELPRSREKAPGIRADYVPAMQGFRIVMPEAGELDMEVFDVLGRSLWAYRSAQPLSAGTHLVALEQGELRTHNFNGRVLPNGVFFFKVNVGNDIVKTGRITQWKR